jgi:hypothetical protein
MGDCLQTCFFHHVSKAKVTFRGTPAWVCVLRSLSAGLVNRVGSLAHLGDTACPTYTSPTVHCPQSPALGSLAGLIMTQTLGTKRTVPLLATLPFFSTQTLLLALEDSKPLA